jgi:hypothetical protein
MYMAMVRIQFRDTNRRRRGCEGGREVERDYRSEKEVLDYWEFAKDFGLIHFDHAGVDFVPCFYLFGLGERPERASFR